ncbi:DUF3800 domain-containing protein [Rhodanobacter sp. 7MK24]|uniref:DUF3800 domain-containing protein n=1 Tax=Rhodanobacter sp. 7MK24 TaxID=2775922 RepID=UPI0017859B5F|nr:DUF3800 domain-containing protein [Rhodanobacter sp. 7MK24]MBD8879532.1 DUF3800 domain-containing protein [Rhodanobacter sp. 7MK24]
MPLDEQDTERDDWGGKRDLAKEQKLEREKALFVQKLAAGEKDTLPTRVAWVLNRHPEARDSDVTLQIIYWRTFDHALLAGQNMVAIENLYRLTRLTNITRARAKIQNEYRMFLASDEVRRRRVVKDEEERAKQVDDRPDTGTITVYSDETGKTDDYLIVGSIWFLKGDDVPGLSHAIAEWREANQFREEFHFTRIRDHNISAYLAVLDLLDRFAATVSFRAIMIERRGHADIQRVLDDMLKHLIIRGVAHGHDTGRAPLPRSISVFKDAEEEVRDKLVVANLTTDLKHASQASFEGKLYVSLVQAVDSKELVPIQLADLFCGCLARRYNKSNRSPQVNGEPRAKDRFADEFLSRFNILPEASKDFGGDMTVVERV